MSGMTYYMFTPTPAGTLLLTGDGQNITGIHWKVFRRAPVVKPEWVENRIVFREAIRQLGEYFAGSRRVFNLDFALKGTKFQMEVWNGLMNIPYGECLSYQAIANTIGKPKAARAVGSAVGSNPMSIVVPCHRVLTSAGTISGYAGGLRSKALLLGLEGVPGS